MNNVVQRMPRLAAILAAFVVALAAPSALSAADAGGANQAVLANATADGSSLSRSGVQVAPAGGGTVASDNLAKAASTNCTGCRSVAVAFQAVLAIGSPSTVTPTNAAVATNAGCTGCFSYAFAYQYVLTTGGPVYLSQQGQESIAAIRVRAAGVAASGLPAEDLNVRLDELAGEFRAVIDQELLEAGTSGSGTVSRRVSIDG